MTLLEAYWDTSTTGENLVQNLTIAVNEISFDDKDSSWMEAWCIGLVCVTLINLCSVTGILAVQFLKRNMYNMAITLFVALGVGSLSASSFYHLLPLAFPNVIDSLDDSGNPTYSYLMSHFALCGVYMFFFCDRIIKILSEWRKKTLARKEVDKRANKRPTFLERLHDDNDVLACLDFRQERMGMERMNRAHACDTVNGQTHGVCVHDHDIRYEAGKPAIATVAWMIIGGDGFHNFIDGVSIGAAFSDSISTGISVSLAVFAEEFPHELGDVAILVASGMTYRQALIYNFLSALTCYAGFIVGVLIGEFGPIVTSCTFAVAGGMFLYISLACMMPEMRKVMEKDLEISMWKGIRTLMLQGVGLFLGIFLIFIMARYGNQISI